MHVKYFDLVFFTKFHLRATFMLKPKVKLYIQCIVLLYMLQRNTFCLIT